VTTLADGPGRPAGSAATPLAEPRVQPDVPVRADGVQLLGAHRGSGYRVPPALVQRADGQVVQLTPLLYSVLAAADGARTEEQIADAVSAEIGRTVVAEDVRTLIDGRLRPLGLVRLADGSEPPVRKANPLLALRLRYVVSDPQRTRRLTGPFAGLFNPVVVVALTLAFAAVAYWVLFRKGLASAANEAFTSPGLLLAVFAITVVSAGFHEFGHAAALRRGGGTPGAMGMGLYLVWPAFYTDVTDSYRLGRGGRLRTDLGGLYFNAIVAVAMFGLWAAIGWDGLLLVIATQILQMIRQLPPMLRFDGYHLLADLTGVPDLYHRIKPTLTSLWPTRWRSPEARVLKPWARVVVTLWVLAVAPLLLLTALVVILTLPRILATAGHSIATQWTLLTGRWAAHDWAGVGAKVLALFAIAVPALGVTYMVSRLVRQVVAGTWRRTRGKPVQRTVAAIVAAAVVAGLAWAWWPRGNYRPIQPNERGVLQQVFTPVAGRAPLSQSSASSYAPLRAGDTASATTVWPGNGVPLPRPGHPQLALVLRPRDPRQPTWVFPFNRPAPPGPGDNQAMAVATKNGSTVYDVAFALVVAGKDTVLNKNEAYAFASCTGCTAVAISFQVVLVVGNAHVVAPQNVSAAVSYNCIRCITAAMAIQLVVSLPGPLDASTADRLAALWAKIREFSRHLSSLSLAQIQARLADYERQIVAIVQDAKSTTSASATSATSVTSGSAAPSAADSTAPTSAGASGAAEPGQSAAATTSSADSSTPPSTTAPSAAASAAPTPSG